MSPQPKDIDQSFIDEGGQLCMTYVDNGDFQNLIKEQ